MLGNYIRTAVRTLRRYIGFTAISVIGLAVAMSVSLLLIMFVRDQAGKDAFHSDSDRIYRIYSDFKASFNRDNDLYATSPADLSKHLASDVPAVEDVAHLRKHFSGTVTNLGKPLGIEGFYANQGFLRLFDFHLRSGNPSTALDQPFSLVIIPSEAERLFGRIDVVGEVVEVQNGDSYTVTGVFSQNDYDTVFPLSAVASTSTLRADSEIAGRLNDWTSSIYRSYTYVKLASESSIDELQSALDRMIPIHYAEREENRLVGFEVQQLTDINLGVLLGNELGVVFPGFLAIFLMVLAAVILGTAAFNYVGLAVSRSLQRAREVGVRKVFGARRTQLFGQFILESVVICILALVGALGLLYWLVGQFNNLAFMQMTGTSLQINYLSDPGVYVIIAAFVLLISIVAGTYPALYLSSFNPSRAVRGTAGLSSGGGSRLRKTLIVAQFAVSIIFVIVTIVMLRQSMHLSSLDYGFETQDVVNVRLRDVPYRRLEDRLSSSTAISDISGARVLPAMGSRNDVWVWSHGDTDPTKAYVYPGTASYTDVLDIDIIAGRALRPEDQFGQSRNVLVNTTLLDALALGTPTEAVGRSFVYNDSLDVTIAGVVESYRSNTPNEGDSPILHIVMPERSAWSNLRITPGRMDDAIKDLRTAWSDLGSLHELEYDVFDIQLKTNFVNVMTQNVLRIVSFVAILSILIACLGLLGIAAFNVQRRRKEISIRKVLGAQAASLVVLLSREFAVLMGIALLIAVPASWVFSNAFLQTYATRVGLGPLTIAAGITAIGILAFATISSQTVRVALADPVENLRAE